MKYSIFFDFQHQWKKEDYSANLIRKEIFHTKKLGVFYLKDGFVSSGRTKIKSKIKTTYSIGVYLIWAKIKIGLRKN